MLTVLHLPAWWFLSLACSSAPTPEPATAVTEGRAGADERGGKGRKGAKQKGGERGEKADRRGRSAKGPSDDEVVAAYLADCHHVFPPVGLSPEDRETIDHADDECRWREYLASCPSACCAASDACEDECRSGCGGCQDRCASTCDDCKAGCEGAAACERQCAEARAGCRNTCTGTKASCEGTCGSAKASCDQKAAQELAKHCPGCEGIRACLDAAEHGGAPLQRCLDRLSPANPPECVSMCREE